MQLYESYTASESRYERSDFYRRCGNSGLMLPRLSFGLWHNFGNITPLGVQQQILRTAFDAGITHFDLANNYGPPYGEAETNFGILMDRDWRPYRDELIISTKAGYDMWPGPYGNFGSRKYLIASADQSLKRMHLDYVDIFYHHRPDPETPLEETMGALKTIVDSGSGQRQSPVCRDLELPGGPCKAGGQNHEGLGRAAPDLPVALQHVHPQYRRRSAGDVEV